MNKMYETSSKRRGITSKKPVAFIAAAIVAIAMMMASCGDNIVESGGQINPTATLNIVVRDATNGNLMDGAEVTLLTAPKGKVNNIAKTVNGTATFRDVYVGTHRVQVELDGYARAVYDADISRDQSESENTYIANNNTAEISLYPFTAGLIGYLYYSKDGVSHPASSARVRFTINEATGIEDRVFTATVNSEGKYEFKNLPAAYGWLTASDFTTGGVTYTNFNIGYVSLNADAPAYVLDKKEYVDKTVPFIWLGSSETINAIGPTDPVVLRFSDNIDASKMAAHMLASINPAQPVTITHDADKITITPFEEWNAPGGRVNININRDLISVKGTVLTGGTHVVINVIRGDLTLPAVQGLIIDTLKQDVNVPQFNTVTVDLKWRMLEGARGYRIYYKKDGDNHYQHVDETNRAIDTALTVNINDWDPIEDNTNYFVVQAYNERAVGTLEGVTPLEVYSRPTTRNTNQVPGQTNVFFAGNTNDRYLGTWVSTNLQNAAAASITFDIEFTEPMSSSVTAEVPASIRSLSGGERVSITASFTKNDSTLTVTVGVTAISGTPASGSQDIEATIEVRGLKSKREKPFFIEYNNVGDNRRKEVRSTLDFRFRNP